MPETGKVAVAVVVEAVAVKLLFWKRRKPGLVRDALLTKEMSPLTAPLVIGWNTTLKTVLCPAARVSGRVSPVMLKPLPVTVACEIVRLDPPELDKFTG